MERNYIFDLGNISGLAYTDGSVPEDDSYHIPIGYKLVEQRSGVASGFNGAAYFNSSTNTLVVGIAGTNPYNPMDLAQDLIVTLGGLPSQLFDAVALTEDARSALASRGITGTKIVFTGHSLGGYISQIMLDDYAGATAVVFNSPGLGGLSSEVFSTLFGYAPKVTYVYSEDWGNFAGLIHTNGMLVNQNVIVIPGTSGHNLNDLLSGMPPECFPAHTPIAISPTQTKSIEDIRLGDTVLSFDPAADLGRGALVPRKVVRLYRSATEEWVKLTWAEGGETKELIATPGHHFLDRVARVASTTAAKGCINIKPRAAA